MLVDGNGPTDVSIEDNVLLPSNQQYPSDLVPSDSDDVDENSISGLFGYSTNVGVTKVPFICFHLVAYPAGGYKASICV
jgi:hypothetical protein